MFCAIEIVDAQQLASAAVCSWISPRARLLPPSFVHAKTAVARAEQRCGVNFYQVQEYRVEMTDHESTHDYI